MNCFFAIIVLMYSFILYGTERESLSLLAHATPLNTGHTFNNPQTTIVMHNTGNIVDHAKDIKKFLNEQSGTEFESEKELFNNHNILRWHGFTNTMILAHAREKLSQLKAMPIRSDDASAHTPVATTPAGLYAQMLENLIEYSETNDKEQKKKLCKKAAITGAGAALLTVIQYFTMQIPNIG